MITFTDRHTVTSTAVKHKTGFVCIQRQWTRGCMSIYSNTECIWPPTMDRHATARLRCQDGICGRHQLSPTCQDLARRSAQCRANLPSSFFNNIIARFPFSHDATTPNKVTRTPTAALEAAAQFLCDVTNARVIRVSAVGRRLIRRHWNDDHAVRCPPRVA